MNWDEAQAKILKDHFANRAKIMEEHAGHESCGNLLGMIMCEKDVKILDSTITPILHASKMAYLRAQAVELMEGKGK